MAEESGQQLGLFQNMDLEEAYSQFHSLNFQKANSFFQKGLNGFCPNREEIHELIEFCDYWSPRLAPEELSTLSETKNREAYFSGFLKDFEEYSFPKAAKSVRSKLLRFLAERVYLENQVGAAHDISELLLIHKEYETASHLLKKLTKENPNEPQLLYKLAKAQFLEGDKTGARKSYAKALFQFPDKQFVEDILDENLLHIIHTHGIELTPAYGRIYGHLPFVEIEGTKPLNEKHDFSLKSYFLLNQIYRAGKKCLEERRKLKAFNPKLFDAYLQHL